MNVASIPMNQLVLLGRKRKWVPMWLWLHVFFRFDLYKVPVIGRLVYVKVSITREMIAEADEKAKAEPHDYLYRASIALALKSPLANRFSGIRKSACIAP